MDSRTQIARVVVDDLHGEIQEIVGSRGADVVIETTGNSRVIEEAYNLTHPDGKNYLGWGAKKGRQHFDTIAPVAFQQGTYRFSWWRG